MYRLEIYTNDLNQKLHLLAMGIKVVRSKTCGCFLESWMTPEDFFALPESLRLSISQILQTDFYRVANYKVNCPKTSYKAVIDLEYIKTNNLNVISPNEKGY